MEENKDLQVQENEGADTNKEAVTETAKETVDVTCPHCQQAFQIEIERPVHTGTVGRRGKLSGKTLEEMSDDDLKVELINSKSVLYKATKRGAAADVIAKNQERVDAAVAEKAKREAKVASDKVNATPETEEANVEGSTEANVEGSTEGDTVYNTDVENEI